MVLPFALGVTSNMTHPLITVVGSLNKDLVTRTSRVPGAGETLTSESFATGSGGKGANQAVACARLSKHDIHAPGKVSIHMIGAVGDDSFANELISDLQQDGINTDAVQTVKGMNTGVSVIIVEEQTGENRILFSPGANYSLEIDHVLHVLKGPNRPHLVVLQLEIRLELVLEVLEFTKNHGIDVLLNPAPALELPETAYPAISHLVLNETEAATLSGESGDDWEGVARKFQDLGVKNVIITLGGKGVFYASADQKGHVPGEKVEVVDTTAAGDTFVGAYAVSVVSQTADRDNVDIEQAVRGANKAAAMTVQKKGAQEAIPYLGELPG